MQGAVALRVTGRGEEAQTHLEDLLRDASEGISRASEVRKSIELYGDPDGLLLLEEERHVSSAAEAINQFGRIRKVLREYEALFLDAEKSLSDHLKKSEPTSAVRGFCPACAKVTDRTEVVANGMTIIRCASCGRGKEASIHGTAR